VNFRRNAPPRKPELPPTRPNANASFHRVGFLSHGGWVNPWHGTLLILSETSLMSRFAGLLHAIRDCVLETGTTLARISSEGGRDMNLDSQSLCNKPTQLTCKMHRVNIVLHAKGRGHGDICMATGNSCPRSGNGKLSPGARTPRGPSAHRGVRGFLRNVTTIERCVDDTQALPRPTSVVSQAGLASEEK
jgi:hypothetical protein